LAKLAWPKREKPKTPTKDYGSFLERVQKRMRGEYVEPLGIEKPIGNESNE